MTTKEKRGIFFSIILFLLYIFVFLLTELTVNARGAICLGSNHVVTLYSVGLICTSLGYVCFFLSRRLVNGERNRKLLMGTVALVYMCCIFCFLFVSDPILFTLSSLASLLLFGYIGGFTHYAISLFLSGKGYTGRVIGTAVAFATVLQFIVQNLLVVDVALIVSLVVSVVGILYLAVNPIKDWMFENPLPYANVPTVTVKELLAPVCVVAIMSLCFGLGDGLVTQLDARGNVNLTSWVRLLYALGVFVAGMIADIGNRHFLPICTLCSLLLFSSMALFIGEGNSVASNIYICVMYLFSGFYVMYLTIVFVENAPMMEQTTLWAGMGRIVRGPFIALTAVLSTTLQDIIGQQGIAVLGVCLSLVVLLLMLFDGQLNMRTEKTPVTSNHMSEFVSTYRFTPREVEVFSLLLDNDVTNKEIAAELLLSLRVLERYISSIYDKTGVTKRVDLLNLYYGKIPYVETISPVATVAETDKTSALHVSPISTEKIEELSVKFGLTKRESELLQQIYLRKTNEDIAGELEISENTVKFHVKNLMKKLSVSSRSEIRNMLNDE